MKEKVVALRISSEEADKLFSEINSGEPDVILERLSFVEAGAVCPKDGVFEYDTDLNHAWYLVGLAHEKKGERSLAARSFLFAIRSWPLDASAYLAYSNSEEDLDAQIKILEDGLQKFEDPRVRFNLSNAYLDSDRPADALSHLLKIPSNWELYAEVRKSLALIAATEK